MWKTPKAKKSEVVETLINQDAVPKEVEGKKYPNFETPPHPHPKTPSHWKGKKEAVSEFVRDFFNHSHNPRNEEDENISLRVLGN